MLRECHSRRFGTSFPLSEGGVGRRRKEGEKEEGGERKTGEEREKKEEKGREEGGK